MLSSPQAILFDLDGTLVDSAPDLTTALKNTFHAMGFEPHSELKVRQWVGNGVVKLLHRALTNSMDGIAEEKLLLKTQKIFREFYLNRIGCESILFPEVEIILQKLVNEKISLGCITNKDRVFTVPLLESLDIKKYFNIVVCGDDLENKKPHPEPLIFAAKKMGIAIDKCLMIGDSKTDITAANDAGMDIVCVDYGYAQGENLSELEITALISDFSAIENCYNNVQEKNSIKHCG